MAGFYLKNGDLYESGRRIQEIGVNCVDLFIDYTACTPGSPLVYQDPARTELFFQRLRARSMRVVRTFILGLRPATYQYGIIGDLANYVSKLDAFIALAESYGIRLILSLYFSQTQIPPYKGETLNNVGVTGSATQNEMFTIATYVTNRYEGSEAIAVWEGMNENDLRIAQSPPAYSVDASMGTPSAWTSADMTTADQILNFNTSFHALLKSLDTTPAWPGEASRATASGSFGWRVVSGAGENTGNNWVGYWKEKITNEATDMMSFHPYCEGGGNRWYNTLFTYPSFKAWVEKIVSGARAAGKVAYIGEIGMAQDTLTANLASPAVAGNVDNGTHRYLVTFVNASGESSYAVQSGQITIVDKTTNGKVSLTSIPAGIGEGITARKIYRTVANGSSYFFLATLAGSAATTYTDNISDASLGAAAPDVTIVANANYYIDGDETLIQTMHACVDGGAQLTLLWQWTAQDIIDPTNGITYPSYETSTRLRVLDAAESINRRLGNT